MTNKFETQYIQILNRILSDGVDRPDRTGVGSRAIWGASIDIDLGDGFPIITTRKTSPRIAFEETWFFLRGETDTKKLEDKKITIWKGNTTREFLNARGLTYLPEGHLGKGYGFQWRNFGGGYATDNQNSEDYYTIDRCGVDQIVDLLHGLKTDPNGRRHIVIGWNPQQIAEMALPPCHLYQQYQVLDGKLNSMFLMRSWDFLYGAPFNIMGYALLNVVFAKYLGLRPGRMVAVGNDVHLYSNQINIAKEQITRTPYPLPEIVIDKELKTIDDIMNLKYTDIKIVGYQAHPDFKNKPGMAI